jgi:Bacterial Ig domain/Bacterial cadherin-like domain
MRSLSALALSLFVGMAAPAAFAHDVTISGTTSFAALDGSSLDHDGVANGVFTVSDGNLVVNGVVNCNDDGVGDSACSMAFAVSGNMTVNSGGALYAENRSGGGTGGNITLNVGGNLALNGTAIVSTASKTSSGANGGPISATVGGSVALASGTTIDAGSANARGGNVTLVAAGAVSVDGNVLSGPSRTVLATRLTDVILDGGTSNSIGGQITIRSTSFAEPAVVVGANANVVSQGSDGGAGPVTVEGCGIQVRGLVAALSRKDSAAKVAIRSGRSLLVDGRDLGGSGTRMGRVRADAPSGTAINKGVDLFAVGSVSVLGPGGSLFVVTSHPGAHDSKSYGGTIRIISTTDAVTASGNVADSGQSAAGDTGGTIDIASKLDANLDGAVIRAIGDSSTNNGNRGGGSIAVRSYSGNVVWTNGTGDVRPVGSSSGLVPADQGSIVLTACGTVNISGSSFPVMGTATSPLPEVHTGVCSPAAPFVPAGTPAFVVCNTPPVANPASASTNEDQAVTVHLSGSDADGDSLTFSIVTPPLHGSLGPVISTGPTTADVTYTPALDYFGSDSFVFRADDGNGGTDDNTASITIAPVNDAPSFQIGASQSVLEDAGAQSVANWVTSISPGPANESTQSVTFTVTNDNPSLFSVQPAVAPNGTLTYTPAANANGSANITVVAHDDGGTANGGVDTSAPQTSSITVTPVNDAPSFTPGGDVTVNEDSGAYSAAWATAISAGPANESSQSVDFVVTNGNNALFSSQPAISPSGVLTFTPAANANGTATVTVALHDDGGTANGGVNTSSPVTFTITVNSVNDAPSFTPGGDVTVLEDSGAYSAAWASAISAGPANESTQSVNFVVNNSNNALFASQPAISPSGVLTFTPAPNAFGSAVVTVTLHDDGGTANGGVDTSSSVTFTINVTGVNDAPSFTPGGNVTLNEDSGAYSATWATAISAGPNEGGQTVNFVVTNDNNALFTSQPAISPSGTLTFQSAPNAFGSATVSVTLHDNGGTANGGVDTSATVTFTITITAVNDPPTAVNDSFDTFGNTELRVDLAAASTPSVVRTTPSGKGVLHNDSDPEGDSLVVTGIVGCGDATAPFDCTLASGKVSMNANGTFSFIPAPGVTSASFQYNVTDQPPVGIPATSTGTVTINITHMIWYVNGSAAAGGDGTSASPFNDFASLNGAAGSGDVDGSNDIIFVHDSTVNGAGLELEDGQHFLGEGVGLTVDSYNLVSAGNKAKFFSTSSAAALIQVAATAEVAGLELHGNDGVMVLNNGSSPGATINASIHDNALVATFKGIEVLTPGGTSTTVNVNNTSISSVNTGFSVSTTSPAFVSFTNGSVVSSAGNGIVWNGGGSANLTITALANVTVDGNTLGDGIDITGATFDSSAAAGFQTVSGGAIAVGATGNPVGAAGIVMSNVSGDYAVTTLNVFGPSGVSVAGSGLFTGSAGMRVTNGGGAIAASTGTALSVTNATIGAANLNFTSIASNGGTATGIILDNTGTAGGLVVTGTGSAGSGGTIANKTGANGATATGNGIYLNNTGSVSLASMNLHDFDNYAIRGFRVNGFSMSGCVINGTNGNSATVDTYGEGSVYFGSTAVNGLTGSATVSSSTISGGRGRNFSVVNTSGTLNRLTISNSTFGLTNTAADSGHSLAVEARNSGTVANVTVTGSTFTGAVGDLANFTGQTGTTMDVVFTGDNGSDNHPNNVAGGGGLTFATSGAMTLNVSNNTLRDANGSAITLFKATAGTSLSGTLNNNQIGVAGVANSGSVSGNGIFLSAGGSGTITLTISNNVIRNYANAGIYADNTGGNYAVNVGITGNTTAEPSPSAFAGLALTAGAPSSTDAISVCANITGNDFSAGDPNDFLDIILGVSTAASTMRLPGYAGSTLADVQTFVFNNNNVAGTQVYAYVDPPATDSNFTGGAACPTP